MGNLFVNTFIINYIKYSYVDGLNTLYIDVMILVDNFCRVAREKHKYSEEQALGMLFWHKHDVDKALQELSNFAPFPDDWSTEDKVLFEQAFSYHGKSFHRIREMVGFSCLFITFRVRLLL